MTINVKELLALTMPFKVTRVEPSSTYDDGDKAVGGDTDQRSREWYCKFTNAQLEKSGPPNHYFVIPKQHSHWQSWRKEQLNTIKRLPIHNNGEKD